MRRLRRPWLLYFPLAFLLIGVVWTSLFGNRSPRADPVAAPPAPLAIASSDLGYRFDPASQELWRYEPRYARDGEEKLMPPEALGWPLPAGFETISAVRTASTLRVWLRNSARQTVSLVATLALDGRSVIEEWVIPSSVAVTAELQPVAGNDSAATRRYRRSITAILPPGRPAIPRPSVSITIDSDDPRDDRVAKALLDDLITAVHPRLRRSIAPMGLTSEIYFGHVFWDADVWVFPALALLDPEAAAEIPKYRLRTRPQARRNFFAWADAGRAMARGSLGRTNLGDPPLPGAKFAWESSETGRETVPGPSRFEDHISGSVAWSVGLADTLGLVAPSEAKGMREEVAEFYRRRTTRTARGREIRDTVSPDEHHTGNNDLFTNLLAQEITGDDYYLPRDRTSFLTYDGDKGKGYKQVAALLAIYPLQYGAAEKKAGIMLDRFAPGVIANGPAMTDAIHAIVAARIGRAEEALGYWRRSWEGFYDLDRGMFSERRKGTRREYFYTGAAGALQSVLYGFVGLRIDRAGGAGILVAKLRNGKELRCSPHLPKGWRSVAISGLAAMGRRFDLKVYADGRAELRPAASK